MGTFLTDTSIKPIVIVMSHMARIYFDATPHMLPRQKGALTTTILLTVHP
jgi:hypothetical protein